MTNVTQVAGIIDADEAAMLVDVDWPGFPRCLPAGKDDISEADATSIIAGLRAPRAGVLISYLTEASEVAAFCSQLGSPTRSTLPPARRGQPACSTIGASPRSWYAARRSR